MIRFLPEAIVMAIHDDQIRLYGGAYGVRDMSALDAALRMPQVQFGGEFFYTPRSLRWQQLTTILISFLYSARLVCEA